MGVELKLMAFVLRCVVAVMAVTAAVWLRTTLCVWAVCHPQQVLCVQRMRADGKLVPAVT